MAGTVQSLSFRRGGKFQPGKATESEWVSEWVSRRVRVSEWVNEWVRVRECEWVRVSESEWGSEGVRDWGGEGVREWGSEGVREWVRECVGVSVSECEWVSQLRRNLPNPASLQRLLQRRTHGQRSCWQRLWTAARAWLKVKLLPRSACRKFLPVLLLGHWMHVSWDSLASLWKGLQVPVQRQHQQKSQQWLPSLQRLCTWQPRTLGLPVAILVGSKWAASVKRGTS